MKKFLSILVLLLLAFDANAQLIPRQTIQPGGGLVHCISTDGVDTPYTCPNATPIITALEDFMPVLLRTTFTNAGAATISIRGIAAVPIVAHDESVLANGAITAGRTYLLIYKASIASFLLYAVGSGGGGALSGLTDNYLLKADGTSNAEISSIQDDGAGTVSVGVVTGNRHRFVPVTPTAVRSHGLPDASGTTTYNRSIAIPIGDRVVGSALTDAHDYPMVWRNNIAPMTITEVWCQSDAGTPIINLQRDDGSPANILSSNLTVTTTGLTGTISTAEDNLAVGDKIGFVMVTAGGVAKEVNCILKATLD